MNIYSISELKEKPLKRWEQDALIKFEQKMTSTHSPFPCIPATQAFALHHLRFGFAIDPRDKASAREVASMLKTFTLHSRQYGSYTTLIIFYNTPVDLASTSVLEFEQQYWSQLHEICILDDSQWPTHIPTDPKDPNWEFCFQGEPYFMFCATPAHEQRQSRYFPYMMLAITPRWVLQSFNENKAYANKIKQKIRNRLEAYDEITPHSELKQYGDDDNYEWKQYFLRDDHSNPSVCPFLASLKKENRMGQNYKK
ncbi:YqcI/YcgG family protein [Alkalihalobacillus sp. LMS39]|uniref:YqcI/YcgG family protein n=1 Tax=Alkalihalobacillus sp. LMS39 TaxID=2924032 RepID=UPI001FB2E647|nr:YqcI/YcgG family protein [Alkalihalobacillus sp. LMS39]UOE92501.1 YqcI/YcgG family protein [Alkalihalobacillus sp. LMS39]